MSPELSDLPLHLTARILCEARVTHLTESYGKDAVLACSALGSVFDVKKLLAAGVDVHAGSEAHLEVKTYSGNSALRLASSGGHTEVVRMLLLAGAYGDCLVDIDKDVSLAWSAQMGYATIVRKLVADGGVPGAVGVYKNPMQYAITRGHLDVVNVLLAAGAKVHGTNKRPFCLAAEFGQDAILHVLIAAGGSDSAAINESLLRAARHGHVTTVRLLLGLGADVHLYPSLLCEAVAFGHFYGSAAVVQALLDAGAHDFDGRAIRYAGWYARPACAAVLRSVWHRRMGF